jgi:hypothetical protein
MILFGILVFLFTTLFDSCAHHDEVEGVVCEVTDNTLTIKTNDNVLVTFSTRRAKMRCPAGIYPGSPVKVSYMDDIADGFGNARSVVAPEEYNLLIGRWVAPYNSPFAENPEMLHGFELLPDGSVIEIGEHSIKYNCWRLRDNKISLAEYVENLDMDSFDFVHHWRIEHLDNSILTISYDGMTKTFARVGR